VIYLDFKGQYVTLGGLLDCQALEVSKEVKVIECVAEIQELLDFLAEDRQRAFDWIFDKANWPKLCTFGRIVAQDDVLPLRSQYHVGKGAANIGVSVITSDWPTWYALPDLIASVFATGKAPRIVEEFKLVPGEPVDELRTARVFGCELDPRENDVRIAVGQKRTEKKDEAKKADEAEAFRLESEAAGLKESGVTGAYGIKVQLDTEERADTRPVRVWAGGARSEFTRQVYKVEKPGAYFAGPLGSLITSGGRL